MMISKESLNCPVCRAGFRGQSECSRCGADLTGLMRLAGRAYYLRDKARADIRRGDIDGACERLRQARNLHNTALGQDLWVLANFLRTIATPATIAAPATAVTAEPAVTATSEIAAAVEQDSVVDAIPQPTEATRPTAEDIVAIAEESATSVSSDGAEPVPVGEQAISPVEEKVVPPVQSSYMQESLSTVEAQASPPTGEHLVLSADEQSTPPAGDHAFTPVEEQTTSSADAEQEPPQKAALPPASAVNASPGRAVRRVRLIPEKSIIATDNAGPLGKLLRRLAFWRRF